MIFGDNHQKYSEDFFEPTRMSFGDHIEDLRRHLIRAIVFFCIAVVVSFFLSPFVLGYISSPIERKLKDFHQVRLERKMAELKEDPEFIERMKPRWETLKFSVQDLERAGLTPKRYKSTKKRDYVEIRQMIQPKMTDLEEIRRIVDSMNTGLITLSIQEALVVYLQVSLVTGFVLGCPWIFKEVWAFIAAGLYPHEKRVVNLYLPFAVVLFIGGILFCYFIVIPGAIDALLWFNLWLNFTPQLRLSEWLSFAIWVPVVFGIAFETPLVMMLLNTLGIGSVEIYRRVRKFAYFGMAVAAALLTPTMDPFTMLYMLAPMVLFYELGIVLAMMSPRRKWLELDVPDSDEMVEV